MPGTVSLASGGPRPERRATYCCFANSHVVKLTPKYLFLMVDSALSLGLIKLLLAVGRSQRRAS